MERWYIQMPLNERDIKWDEPQKTTPASGMDIKWDEPDEEPKKGGALSAVADIVGGTLETIPAFASGVLGFVAGQGAKLGETGVRALGGQPLREAFVESGRPGAVGPRVTEALTYHPRTRSGAGAVEMLAKPFELYREKYIPFAERTFNPRATEAVQEQNIELSQGLFDTVLAISPLAKGAKGAVARIRSPREMKVLESIEKKVAIKEPLTEIEKQFVANRMVNESIGELKSTREEPARVAKIEKVEGIEAQGKVAMLEKMIPEKAEVVSERQTYSQKNPIELTRDELDAEFEAQKMREQQLDVDILGKEDAVKFNKATRQLESQNSEIAKKAQDFIDSIEDRLAPEDFDALYGIGEQRGHSAETLKEFKRAVDDLSFADTAQELGSDIRFAITDIGKADISKPETMSTKEHIAATQLAEAMRIAKEKGWDTNEVSKAAIESAARRFRDPVDAEFMLSRFKKVQQQLEAPEVKLTAPEKPVAAEIPVKKGVAPDKGILEATIGDIASEEGALTLMKTPIRDAMEVQKTSTVEKVQSVFDEQRSAVESVNKMKPKEWLGRLNRAIVDVSGNAKNTLIKKAGKEGQKAVMEHDLIAGASAKANMEVGEVIDSMTKGLKKEQYEYMNDFIQAKRAIAISKYKKDFKHAGGIETKEYAEWIDSLPKETRVALEERSRIFFDTMKKKLGELRKEGLITEEGFNDLVSKGDYAPRSLRKYIDFEESGQLGGKKISVEGSGIKRLKQGDIGLLENDSELMLREVVGRVEHRIARNRANKALHNIAKVDPNNSIVKIGKVKAEFYVKNKAKNRAIKKFRDPKKAHEARLKFKNPDNYEVIRKDVPRDKLQPHEDYVNVVIDGKTIPLVLNKEFARDWVTRETVIDPNVANLVQWVSGSKILRPMATGINLAFALTNLPRDMARALIVSEEFSPHLPVGFAQLIKDMSAVASDSVLRKGRYRDYINEGGGMSFLTHQGQTFKPGSTMAKVGSYLGYIGETSEILVRLAIRERGVSNRLRREGQVGLERMGEIQREATYEARNQLDFSQGGWLTKAADNAVPYLNAAVQGTRGMFRAARRNPKRFTYQVGQIGALASGLYYMNHFLNGEAYSQISDRDKANNWIITTPFWFKDNQGNKRYYFGKIPKDQSQRVFAAMFEGLSAKFIGEDVNVDMTVQTITDLTPVGPTDFLPPTIEAALGYAANKDFWRNQDIWKSKYGGEVDPKEEYTPYTHPFFVQTGEVTGLSPERLKFALSNIFTHSNIYTDMGGYLWKQTLSNMPENMQERTSEEIILNKPGIRRLVEATNPYYAHEKQLREAKTKASTERLKQNREIDTLSQQYVNGDIDKNQLLGFIREAAPQDRRRLFNRHQRRMRIKDLPNRRWWLDIAEMSPEARALEFYRVYNDSSKKEQQEMWINAKKVPGMTSDRFRREIFRLIRGGSN